MEAALAWSKVTDSLLRVPSKAVALPPLELSLFHLADVSKVSLHMDAVSFSTSALTVCETVVKRTAGVPGGRNVLIEEYVKPFIWDCAQGGTDVLLYIDKNLGE